MDPEPAEPQAPPGPPGPYPLLDKILSRFKILRRGPSAVTRAPETNLLSAERSSTSLDSPPESQCNIFDDLSDNSERKFKVTDLVAFCTLINRFLRYIQSTREFSHLISNYPSKFQNLLDAQVKELHAMQTEARAALIRITQLKNQRKAVHRECNTVAKSLTVIQEEEIKEMENYIAHYDKTLMSRWEKIRASAEKDTVESFMHDLKGKQKALDYLHTLATNKLNLLNAVSSQLNNTEELKPMNVALRRLSNSSGARGSSIRRRSKHNERAVKTMSSSTNQDSHSTSQVPPPTTSFILSLGQATNSGGSSRTSWASAVDSPINIPSLVNTPGTTNITTNSALPNTPERRSILQALFNDIHHAGTHDNLPINAVVPHLIASTSLPAARVVRSGRTEGQNTNSSSITLSSNDIELFTINHQS